MAYLDDGSSTASDFETTDDRPDDQGDSALTESGPAEPIAQSDGLDDDDFDEEDFDDDFDDDFDEEEEDGYDHSLEDDDDDDDDLDDDFDA